MKSSTTKLQRNFIWFSLEKKWPHKWNHNPQIMSLKLPSYFNPQNKSINFHLKIEGMILRASKLTFNKIHTNLEHDFTTNNIRRIPQFNTIRIYLDPTIRRRQSPQHCYLSARRRQPHGGNNSSTKTYVWEGKMFGLFYDVMVDQNFTFINKIPMAENIHKIHVKYIIKFI